MLLPFLLLVNAVTGTVVSVEDHELGCGIYPSCKQYGVGTWQILEDCHKYITCTLENGEYVQQNLECPGDLVYAEEYGECVDYNMATECKVFQETPCFLSCPRVYLESTGPSLQYQERRLGCFRLSGTMLGILSHYQNSNGQYLAPDATSTQLIVHWLISERFGAINGGIRNDKYDWVRCPFTGWNLGWQASKSTGIWMDDESMTVTCLRGNEDIVTTTSVKPTNPPTAPTTSPQQPTTSPQQPTTTTHQNPTTSDTSVCRKEGPVMISECNEDFTCCKWQNNEWNQVKCHCNSGFIFSEFVGQCTWPDVEGCWRDAVSSPHQNFTRVEHFCDDGTYCY